MAQSIALAPNHEPAEGLLGGLNRLRLSQGTRSPAEKTGGKQAGSGLWPRKASPLERQPRDTRSSYLNKRKHQMKYKQQFIKNSFQRGRAALAVHQHATTRLRLISGSRIRSREINLPTSVLTHSNDSIPSLTVLPRLVKGIHVLRALQERRGWPGQARPRRLK